MTSASWNPTPANCVGFGATQPVSDSWVRSRMIVSIVTEWEAFSVECYVRSISIYLCEVEGLYLLYYSRNTGYAASA